jgi:hypothetical protein
MGGTVGFESVMGNGATFWVELPIYERDAEPDLGQAGQALDDQNFDAPRIRAVADDADPYRVIRAMAGTRF